MKRFWISWYQPVGEDCDYRPIYDPKKESEPFGHRYWCSGEVGIPTTAVTICAVVDATSEENARAQVRKYWPDAGEWRFCNECEPDWMPDGGRFPMTPIKPSTGAK